MNIVYEIALGAAFAALLLFASVKDLKTKRIPDYICICICALAMLRVILCGITPFYALFGLAAGGIPWLIIALLKKGSVGGGDIMLFAAAGLFLGFDGACFMVILSCLMILCVCALHRLRKKEAPDTAVPIAPYIAAGGIITYILILIPN